MRIAMLGQKGVPAHSGGIEQHVDVLSRHLAARGHEVIVYCRRSYCNKKPGSPQARSAAHATCRQGDPALAAGADAAETVRRIFRPSIPTKHLDAITHTTAATLDVILRRADVVHYHALGPAALAPLARLAGLPVVVTVHGLDWQRAKWGRWARRCLRFGERMAARFANRLVVVSPVLKDYFAKNHGVPTTFIPNGVMPMRHRQPERLVELGIEPGKFVVSISRLVPEKGLHYLIDAFSRLKTDYKLVIAGGGGFDRDYERRLHERADERVVFLGPVDRDFVAELYSHAALFVLPSDLEGMSIALLEAMNMALPVLVSDIPENACVVGQAGFTFSAGNADDLYRQLDRLLSDPQALAGWGDRAARHVVPYQWPVVVEQLERVYGECCRHESSRQDADPSSNASRQLQLPGATAGATAAESPIEQRPSLR